MSGLLLKILEVLEREGPLSPGDVAQRLAEPRYKVLASFHCLRELGLISEVYSKGSYKVFRVSIVGEALLKEAARGASISGLIEKAIIQYGGDDKNVKASSGGIELT